MFKHPLNDLYWRLNNVWTKTRDYSIRDDQGRGSKILLNDDEREELKGIAEAARDLCLRFEMTSAVYRAQDLYTYSTCDAPCPVLETWQALDRLLTQLQDDMRNKFFVYLPVARVKLLFEWQDEGLIEAVKSAFGDDAAYDLGEAIECYLADTHTACVFHLMRAAEYGLRALAWDRQVKFSTKRPIEFRDWNDVLSALEKAEREIEGWKKTRAQEAQLVFYHDALIQLRAFKNLYRNPTDHAREIWDEHQARSALTHVSAFLKILVSKISLKKRTPKRWTNAQL